MVVVDVVDVVEVEVVAVVVVEAGTVVEVVEAGTFVEGVLVVVGSAGADGEPPATSPPPDASSRTATPGTATGSSASPGVVEHAAIITIDEATRTPRHRPIMRRR